MLHFLQSRSDSPKLLDMSLQQDQLCSILIAGSVRALKTHGGHNYLLKDSYPDVNIMQTLPTIRASRVPISIARSIDASHSPGGPDIDRHACERELSCLRRCCVHHVNLVASSSSISRQVSGNPVAYVKRMAIASSLSFRGGKTLIMQQRAWQ